MAKVEGLHELIATLRKLPANVQKRVLRPAMREAANVVRDAAQANALQQFQGEGTLAEAIAQKSGRGGKSRVLYRVGVEGGAKKNEATPYYWRFLEFGTVKMPARPFMRPAFENNKGAILQTITDKLRKGLAREASRAAKARAGAR